MTWGNYWGCAWATYSFLYTPGFFVHTWDFALGDELPLLRKALTPRSSTLPISDDGCNGTYEMLVVGFRIWCILFRRSRAPQSCNPRGLLPKISRWKNGISSLGLGCRRHFAYIILHCCYLPPHLPVCAPRSNLGLHLRCVLPTLECSSDYIVNCTHSFGHFNLHSATENHPGSPDVTQAQNWCCDLVWTWCSVSWP